MAMEEDEEMEVELSKGNSVTIKYKALSELQPNGKRCAGGPLAAQRLLFGSRNS